MSVRVRWQIPRRGCLYVVVLLSVDRRRVRSIGIVRLIGNRRRAEGSSPRRRAHRRRAVMWLWSVLRERYAISVRALRRKRTWRPLVVVPPHVELGQGRERQLNGWRRTKEARRRSRALYFRRMAMQETRAARCLRSREVRVERSLIFPEHAGIRYGSRVRRQFRAVQKPFRS